MVAFSGRVIHEGRCCLSFPGRRQPDPFSFSDHNPRPLRGVPPLPPVLPSPTRQSWQHAYATAARAAPRGLSRGLVGSIPSRAPRIPWLSRRPVEDHSCRNSPLVLHSARVIRYHRQQSLVTCATFSRPRVLSGTTQNLASARQRQASRQISISSQWRPFAFPHQVLKKTLPRK